MSAVADKIAIAGAIFVRAGTVLLAHRTPTRAAYPGMWSLIGGHVEPGETPQTAVRRECQEEVGVHILDPRPVGLVVEEASVLIHGFVVTRWRGELANHAPQEHDGLRWFAPDELEGLPLAHPQLQEAIARAIGHRPTI